jgi:hypothetical protein
MMGPLRAHIELARMTRLAAGGNDARGIRTRQIVRAAPWTVLTASSFATKHSSGHFEGQLSTMRGQFLQKFLAT